MKGLILTAGKGTRLRPLSYTKPKPLLPVANESVISYGIEQLYDLGIREIGLVIQKGQKKLFNKHLQNYAKNNIQFHYIYQHKPKGVAHAVKQAKTFIGSDSFVLLLGDNLIEERFDLLKDAFNKKKIHGTVMVSEVTNPEDYGIAEIKNNTIINVEEKPANPKSNLAIIGAYLFTSKIFKAIDSISPSKRGEYEITDAIQWMIDHGYTLNYVQTFKPTFDVGTIDRWLEANRWILQKKPQHWDNNNLQDSIIIPPVNIGSQCHIKNSIIGPNVSIESNTTIEKCIIKNSIILKGSCLENILYEITDSVFGEKTKLIGRDLNDNTIHGVFSDDSSLIFNNNNNSSSKNKE
ncbi:sugar phosphate nucleotidyltransferase [Halobacillus seohaensis]|uniref:Sugar phosphate nucleotidyltransferase n=1 Tax=Halobacillus seohaensis TaxID=447421 RepID=A0ABW2EIA0_9BACI